MTAFWGLQVPCGEKGAPQEAFREARSQNSLHSRRHYQLQSLFACPLEISLHSHLEIDLRVVRGEGASRKRGIILSYFPHLKACSLCYLHPQAQVGTGSVKQQDTQLADDTAELKNNTADWKMSVSAMQVTLSGLSVKSFSSSLREAGVQNLRTGQKHQIIWENNSQVYSVIQSIPQNCLLCQSCEGRKQWFPTQKFVQSLLRCSTSQLSQCSGPKLFQKLSMDKAEGKAASTQSVYTHIVIKYFKKYFVILHVANNG